MVKYYSNGMPFIPFSCMMETLRNKYPEVVMHVDVTPDPAHEPNTWVATCKIWKTSKDMADNNYDISVSARRSPSDAVDEESVDITPFDAVQVAAIRKALILLGFGIPTEEAEKLRNEYIEKISSVSESPVPVSTEETNKETTTPTPESAPVAEPKVEEAPVEKTKHADETKTAEKKPTSKKASEPAKEAEPSKPEKKAPKNKAKTVEEEKAVVETESNMTLEEALNMPCNWQSREETLGELMDTDRPLFDWMSTSTMYAKRHPKEYAAIQLILKLKK